MQRIHQGVEKYKEENARKEAEYQIIREAERQKIEMERQHEEQIARQQAELTRQRQEAEAAASRSGNDDFVEEEFGSIWTENSARLAKDIESPKAETRVGTVGGNSFLPAADDKTCFVCGKTGDPFTRVIPYLCSSCVSQLSPAHKAEFKAIGWKRLPGVIVMLAALCVSIANLMTDLTTRATNWTNTFLGFGCFIVGFLVNLGIASSLKTKYKEFALKIAQEKKHAPISNPVPSGQSCPACHARISSNATFCGSCGRKVDGKVDFV